MSATPSDCGGGRVKHKKIAILGLMLTLALVLGYVERLIPFNVGIAGVKIGLANIIVLYGLKKYGLGSAMLVNILRIAIVNLLFGGVVSLVFSLFGGLLSTLAMYLVLKLKVFGTVGVSAVGGTLHNLGQTLAAALLLGTPAVLNLLPYLMVFGELSGILCGIAAKTLSRYLNKIMNEE